MRLVLTLLMFSLLALTGVSEDPANKLGTTVFALQGNVNDSTQLPCIKADNGGGAATFSITATLTDTNGKTVKKTVVEMNAAPGKSEITPLSGKLEKEILLFTAEISDNAGNKTLLSGIYGQPKPTSPQTVDIFGMNVHLGRFDAATQWKLLQMLKSAGITTVRLECTFLGIHDRDNMLNQMAHLETQILGLEAFGIRPLTLIGYFNPVFYESPEKMQMAYVYAAATAARFKGRTDWHYGNETNSGWAAFGAAADMGALNKAFALGTASVDPSALKGSFGIAEGLNNYVNEFIKTGVLSYLDAICVHPYCGTPENGIAKSVAAKELIRTANGKQQVWATEIGFHVDSSPGQLNKLTGELTAVFGFSLLHQQQLLPALFITGKSHGVDRIYWYDFFGLYDPETFWLIDKDYQPRPAYKALTECTKHLKNTIPAGASPFYATIQRHVFSRQDGSVLLACWSLKDNVMADFKLPAGVKIYNDLGETVKRPEDGVLQLGHGVLYIEGLTTEQLPNLVDKDVIASTLDKRNFFAPMSRFTVKPGTVFEVPIAVFNGGKTQVAVKPAVRRTVPGWNISIPEQFVLAPEKSEVRMFSITVPADAVPGVEYEFTFGADVNELRQTQPYTIRVKTEGIFPYRDIVTYDRPVDYPCWDPMNETLIGFGRSELTAKNDNAVIDADLKEWKKEEFYPLDQKFQWIMRDPGVPSNEDWSGKVALRWDDKYIYAAFLVEDNDLCFTDLISRDWRDSDNIRLFLSSETDEAKRSPNISDKDLLLIMTPTGISHTESPMVNVAPLGGKIRPETGSKIKTAAKVWKNGYVMEVAIPVTEFALKPQKDMVIGLNVMADDADSCYRQHVAMTYFKRTDYWNSPQTLGKLILK